MNNSPAPAHDIGLSKLAGRSFFGVLGRVIGAVAILLCGSAAWALPVAFNAPSDVPVTSAGFTATGQSLTVTLNFSPTPGDNLMVVKNTGTGPIDGAFSNVAQGANVALTHGGTTFQFIATYFGGNGNDLVLLWPGTTAFAWGYNFSGQLGNGNRDDVAAPVPVLRPGLLSESTLTSIMGGGFHTMAMTSTGQIYSWGYNGDGELGDGSVNDRTAPDSAFMGGALAGKTVIAVAGGSLHSLALTSDGQVFSWGYNGSGQLGDGTGDNHSIPMKIDVTGVLAGQKIIAVAGGDDHSLALADNGKVYGWGRNDYGQLGNDSTGQADSPVAADTTGVLAGKTVVAISGGHTHSLALTADGKLFAWGYNQNGQLGNGSGTDSAVPVAVSMTGALAGKTVKAIAAGGDHNLVLTTEGKVYAWGRNDYGQLGDDSNLQSDAPIAVDATGALSGKTIIAIATGHSHSLALASTGQLFAWGNNSSGQLGDGTGSNRPSPVPVDAAGALAGKTITSIASGGDHTLILAAAPQAPDIAVNQPADRVLIDGVSTVNFGSAPAGSTITRVFTIRNTGSADLTGFTITKSGPNAAEYSVSGPSTSTLTANTGATFSVQLTADGPGMRSAVIHIASNDPDEMPFDIGLTGLGLTESDVWRQTWFGDPLNAGDGADAADPDDDGIANLVEFATLGNPTGASAPVGSLVWDGQNLNYSYTCNKAAVSDGIVFVAEWTENLASGLWSTNGVTTTVVDHVTTETVTATVTAGTSGRRFMRLRVTRP